jgi:hypothetical protein
MGEKYEGGKKRGSNFTTVLVIIFDICPSPK